MKKKVIFKLIIACIALVAVLTTFVSCDLFASSSSSTNNAKQEEKKEEQTSQEQKQDDKQEDNPVVVEKKYTLVYRQDEKKENYIVVGIDIENNAEVDVVIPDYYLGKAVKYIDTVAFKNRSTILSVDIPDTVVSIGSEAFLGCGSLSSVSFGKRVAEIGRRCFSGCDKLRNVKIKDLVMWCGIYFDSAETNPLYYGHNLYLNDNLITSLTIPSDITEISPYSFYGCQSVYSITVPQTVTSIGIGAFGECLDLERITIPFVGTKKDNSRDNFFGTIFGAEVYSDNVLEVPSSLKTVVVTGGTKIAANAFNGCKSITSITLPDSILVVSGTAFYGCDGLKNLTLPFVGETKDGLTNNYFGYVFGATSSEDNTLVVPKSLQTLTLLGGKKIAEKAFYGCTFLQNITLASETTDIGKEAFCNCSSLQSITIGKDISSFAKDAFFGCEKTENVYIADLDGWCKVSFEGASSNPLLLAENLYVAKTRITSLTFSENVTSIPDYAFCGCASIESVMLTSAIERVGKGAFYQCEKLIKAEIAYVGEKSDATSNAYFGYIFGGETKDDNENVVPASLTKVTLSEGIETLGKDSFVGCVSIQEIILPESLKLIEKGALKGCLSLAKISLPFIGERADGQNNNFGWIFGAEKGEVNVDFVPSEIKNVVFTQGTVIAKYAFKDCASVLSVTLPDTVMSIQEGAFIGCESLSSFTLPTLLTAVEKSTFEGCISLQKVVFGEEIVSIKEQAFKNCESLSSVSLGKKVTSIAKEAFFGCKSLENITASESIEKIGEKAFHQTKWLDSQQDGAVYLTNILYYYKGVLQSNYDITVRAYTKSIAPFAFSDCGGLKGIAIPETVSSIGQGAFQNCNQLVSMTLSTVGGGQENNNYLGYLFGADAYENNNRYVPSSLTTITFENASIPDYSLFGCSSLQKVYLRGVSTIGEHAFDGCTSLTTVSFTGCRETTVGKDAFASCTAVANLTVDNLASWCSLVFANETANPLYFGHHLTANGVLVDKFVKPEGIATISSYAFCGNADITEVDLTGVTEVGAGCFESCPELYKVTVSSSLSFVHKDAFYDCGGLSRVYVDTLDSWISVQFENSASNPLRYAHRFYLKGSGGNEYSLTTSLQFVGFEKKVIIQPYAFYRATCFTQIDLTGVGAVGKSAFYGCEALTRVSVETLLDWCEIYFEDNVANPLYYAHKLYVGGDELTEISSFPEGIKTVKQYAFVNMTDLTVVDFDGIEGIGEGAFYGCTSLEEITISPDITSVGENAFVFCSSVEEVNISNVNKWISIDFANAMSNPLYYAGQIIVNDSNFDGTVIFADETKGITSALFRGCTSLTAITIPDSVTSICQNAFNSCDNLIKVYYRGTEEDWDGIEVESYGNDDLTTATRYYYSVEEPTAEGNYWHYAEGSIVEW